MARDTNFYYSFLVLPSAQRQAIVAAWDFFRAVDDAVDEPPQPTPEGVVAAVNAWRREVSRVFEGGSPQSPQGRALQPHVARFGLSRAHFEHLIEGVAMDTGDRRYQTFGELREYCLRVASAVGLVCIEIFGVREARGYAVDLGIALQLTNILRDIPTDLARGRLYVPLDEMDRFGCREADLRPGSLAPRVVSLLNFQAERARQYYASARAQRPPGSARRLVAAEIMAAVYRAILDRIEARGYDVFTETVRVPRPRRAVIAATTWARVLAGLA